MKKDAHFFRKKVFDPTLDPIHWSFDPVHSLVIRSSHQWAGLGLLKEENIKSGPGRVDPDPKASDPEFFYVIRSTTTRVMGRAAVIRPVQISAVRVPGDEVPEQLFL